MIERERINSCRLLSVFNSPYSESIYFLIALKTPATRNDDEKDE